MFNKTSDKNVANIKDEIKEIKESIEEAYRCYDYDLDYNPFSREIAEMIEHILKESEQKDRQIQELAEEKNACENEIQMYLNTIKEYDKKIKNDYIPKQAVIDKIEDIEYYFDRLNGPDEDIEYIRQVKKELLEEEIEKEESYDK